MNLIHFLNPGAQLKELNMEYAIDALKKSNARLIEENERLRKLLGKYQDLSTPDNVHVLSACIDGVTQDLDLAS